MERPRQHMALDVWSKILHDYVVPYKHLNEHLNPPTLIPSKDGEPLLHPHLHAMLQAASDVAPDLHIDVYTHGLLLPRKPDFIPFLSRLPNNVRLMVTYHFYNHDGSENDYRPLTAYLRFAIDRWPKNVELILASHLIAPMTRERLDEWAASVKAALVGFPATVVPNVNINPWTGRIKGENLYHHGRCPYEQFDHLFFGVTGNILSCCMDLEEEIVHGNVMRDDPQEMVEKVAAFYAAQKRHDVAHALCHDCFGWLPAPQLIQLGGMA